MPDHREASQATEHAHVEKTPLAGPPPGMTTPEQVGAARAAKQAQEANHDKRD